MMIVEKDLYPELSIWLSRFLSDRHRKAQVRVLDTSKTKLSKVIFEENLVEYFPHYNTFDIQVDVIGIVQTNKRVLLAIIECKLNSITLRDIGQIWGYSKVANPEYSFIISPSGPSESLYTLLKTFGRYDLLEYRPNKRTIIANWDRDKKDLDYSSILPPGELK